MTLTTPAQRSLPTASTAPRLTGTGTLLRLYLHVSRRRLVLWVVGLTALDVLIVAAFPGLYPDAAARQQRAALITSSPAAVSFSGPGFGVDDYTFGAMMANEMLGFVAVLVALMAAFLVVRHARGDEEAGRTELVRAGIVGRHAPMAAAFTVAALASLAVGVLTAAGLVLSDVPSISVRGSLVYSAALTAVGLTFAAVALLTSQVAAHARAASGLAGLTIGVAYLLRAIGDIGEGPLRWLSPIGWAQQTGAFVLDRVWPLLLAVAAAALLVLAAVRLNDHRDHGAGTIRQRGGPAEASPRLGTPFGLALRLHRVTVIAWAVSLVAFAAIYGTLMVEVEQFASDNPVIQRVLAASGSSLLAAFLSMIVGVLVMFVSIFAVQTVLRIRTEETAGRSEPILATSVSRVGWTAPHLVIAAVAGSLLAVASATALGASGALVLDRASVLSDALGAAAVQLPAMLVVIGVAAVLVGWLPRLAALSWLVVTWSLFAGMLGGLLQLPQWAMNLSPFAHVPPVPAGPMAWPPTIIMTVLGAALIAAGIAGARRRDLATN